MRKLEEAGQILKNWLTGYLATYPDWTVPFSLTSDINPVSEKSGIAPAILALKTAIQTGIWNSFDSETQDIWIKRIISFQNKTSSNELDGLFIDKPVEATIARPSLFNSILKKQCKYPVWLWRMSQLRQVLSTFHYLGKIDLLETPAILQNESFIRKWIKGVVSFKDIWSGYSHLSGLYTILNILEKGKRKLPINSQELLKYIDLENTVNNLKNLPPKMSVSGAMKLTTLADISGKQLPCPEILIDCALSLVDANHVCYFLNPLVVLDRASKNTSYKKDEIDLFFNKRVEMLEDFKMPDGGYSTLTTGSITNYAQIKATLNNKESDIHAAHILAWAITLLSKRQKAQLDWIEPPT